MKKKNDIRLLSRLGNKKNDIKYFLKYLPLDIKNIVEPFGGSFAVIHYFYKDDKYNKYVNDNDDNLHYIYKYPEEYKNLVIECNNIAKNNLLENKKLVDYKKFKKEYDKLKYDEILKEEYKKNRIVLGCVVKYVKDENINEIYDEEIEKMKKINFYNKDYLEILEQHYKNKDTFIFLDPPYLFSNNSCYQKTNEKKDCTGIYMKILEYLKNKKTKAKIMLIINDLEILRLLFKDYLVDDYDKIYQLGKRKEKILIICNYKI
jgi:site-specific DNA-adenine methylase